MTVSVGRRSGADKKVGYAFEIIPTMSGGGPALAEVFNSRRMEARVLRYRRGSFL